MCKWTLAHRNLSRKLPLAHSGEKREPVGPEKGANRSRQDWATSVTIAAPGVIDERSAGIAFRVLEVVARVGSARTT